MIDDFLSKQKHTPKKDREAAKHSQSFEPPEAVAANEAAENPTPEIGTPPEQKSFNHKRSKWERLKHWRPTRKQAIIIAVCAVFLIGGGIVFALTRPDTQPITAPKKAETPKPKPLVAKLTGLPINDPAINQRPVTAVVIENSPDARPQSGLEQMGVVFEAIAEGGITRFVGLYQDTQPDYIGPVRSLRPYYTHWSMGFDAPVAHVGGSPEALAEIRAPGGKDLDQFFNSGAYQRISSRYAPHNVYTSAAKLSEIETKKGFTTSTYTGFLRKPDAKSSTPNASVIDLNPSSALYASHYDYDPATNTYIRSQAGKQHIVVNAAGAQGLIKPKVIIALIMPQGLHADGKHTTYKDIGNGPVIIFQDGIAVAGTWTKPDARSQITFTDAKNQPIKLNAGQTWLTAVGGIDRITHR